MICVEVYAQRGFRGQWAWVSVALPYEDPSGWDLSDSRSQVTWSMWRPELNDRT